MNTVSNVRLRAVEPEDLDLLYGIENDTRLWNVGTTNVPYSRYTLHDYIPNSADDIYTDRQVRLIVENEEGRTVGLADLVRFDPQHLRAEAGIVILADCRRKGYAASAVRQLCDYALQVLHLHQLYVVIATSNEASLALFQQFGYQQSGILRDWLYDGHIYHDAVIMQRFL
jgi:diamine N-acetyltransferase